MESIQRLVTHRLLTTAFTPPKCRHISRTLVSTRPTYFSRIIPAFTTPTRNHRSVSAGWFVGIGQKKNPLPDIVKAGDPVLHEPAQEVRPDEIGSDRVQKIVDDMVMVMRKAPGVGLAAPQIGIPLRVSICTRLNLHCFFSVLFEMM